MNTKVLKLFWIILLAFVISCKENSSKAFTRDDIAIIPEPLEMSLGEGAFEFNSNTVFVISDKAQKEIAQHLTKKFQTVSGWNIEISTEIPASNYVELIQDESILSEHYIIDVSESHITIKAIDKNGFIYGLESIRQLLPLQIENTSIVSNVDWIVPSVHINDGPQFQWRGLMLDVSRHFFEKEYVLQTIDRLAFLKMNILHLHLVDDQGWRIEIKKYPKLTEVGAFRVDQEDKHWNNRSIPDPMEKGIYGGFYTQEDIKEIVSYAASKGITVVPEIEMPAHVMSAIAAYPELSCTAEPIAVPSGGVWPITEIYCPGKESTFEFLENVLLEVMDLFPSKYIHIGGDEATKTNWETCPYCQKRMKEENLHSVEELQSYFIKRIERFLSSKGRVLIGWDEILEGGLAPGATVMSWRGIQGGWEASKEGHDVVMSPGTHCYFDHYQGTPENEPLAIGGYIPLPKVYEFTPIVDSMSQKQKKHVLGGQANLWSEYITNVSHSEYMLFPRLTALSEALWTPREKKSWNNFSRKAQKMFSRFDKMEINYATSAYDILTSTTKDEKTRAILLELKSEFAGDTIKYVDDDSEVTVNAMIYSSALPIDSTKTIKAQVFKDGAPVGKLFEKTYKYHKAVGKDVIYNVKYSDSYQGVGSANMVNILRGTTNFRDGQWQGWLNENMEVTLDFGKPTSIENVIVGTMENQGSDIYFPTKITVMTSLNDTDFQTVGTITRPYKPSAAATLRDFHIGFDLHEARYIKVIATNLKENTQNRGTWLFVDEIIVE